MKLLQCKIIILGPLDLMIMSDILLVIPWQPQSRYVNKSIFSVELVLCARH